MMNDGRCGVQVTVVPCNTSIAKYDVTCLIPAGIVQIREDGAARHKLAALF